MKIKAHWKSINPFHPDPNQLGYTKTIEVSDDMDLTEIEQFAKDDTITGYKFSKIEIL